MDIKDISFITTCLLTLFYKQAQLLIQATFKRLKTKKNITMIFIYFTQLILTLDIH